MIPGYIWPAAPAALAGIFSGAVGSGDLDNNTVYSGNIASGQVGWPHLSSGSVLSGHVASGQLGRFHIASGQLAGFELGSGAIVSGRVASGQLGGGHIANAGILSGNIASGNVDRYHLASGVLQGALGIIIDGGGAAVTSGPKGYIQVPYACRINSFSVFSDQSGGSVCLGVWKDSYANFPPTSGDTISASGVPLISGAIRVTYSGTAALSGWTTALAKGDVIGFTVLSGVTMTQVSVSMQVGVGD